ncbi:hypothetical protein BD309DRAFT_740202 [Dichomitus squalens]|nr:hypothetical protein BD309DRAFT_740202 [Dichomitus squalens]
MLITVSNGALITVLLGEAMFLMRLYAAYKRSKLLLVIIALLYAAELAVRGVILTALSAVADILVYTGRSATATAVATSVVAIERPSSFPIPGCLFTPPKYPRLSIAAWSVAMCASCIHFLLILHKFAGTISLTRQSTPPNRVSIWELGSISPLVWSFVRDSAVYFFLVFAGNLVYLLFGVMFQRRALTVMSTSWLAAVYSISASRLCLNTRESLQRQTSEDDTFEDVLDISNQFIAPSGARIPAMSDSELLVQAGTRPRSCPARATSSSACNTRRLIRAGGKMACVSVYRRWPEARRGHRPPSSRTTSPSPSPHGHLTSMLIPGKRIRHVLCVLGLVLSSIAFRRCFCIAILVHRLAAY